MKKITTGILMSIVSCSLMVMVFLIWYTLWWAGEWQIGTFESITIITIPIFVIYLMLENFIIQRTSWNSKDFSITTILIPLIIFIIAHNFFSGEHINQVVNVSCIVLSVCLLIMRSFLGLIRLAEKKKQRRKK